jgi:hypothetical protein
MAAETLTNDPLQSGPAHGLFGNVKAKYFSVAMNSDAKEDGDIWVMGQLPKNSMVIGGWIATDDLDTGTEALDVDVGWAANTGASATYTDPDTGIVYTNAGATADPDGLCDCGVLTGDGVAGAYQAGVNFRQFVLPKPLFFSEKTTLQLEANAAAGTQAAGTFGVYVLYYML